MDNMDRVDQSNEREQQALESRFGVPSGPLANEAAVDESKLVYKAAASQGLSKALQRLVEATALYRNGGRYFWPDPVPVEERTGDCLKIRNGVVWLGQEVGLETFWRRA